ncbi:hypothetical protein Pcac1_g25100 [Phytophthora cactorum]|nr:hypothetical protein Pcac1_g25100 [Phytophthora cactorum]KAG3015280.1 hypothetical protein PC120_g12238 [Phytophthora cactorum]
MDNERSTEASMLYQGIGMLLLCIIFFVVWLMACRRNRHLLDMEVPLLSGESVDHRIDAATREAEAGYSICASCEFENFKRFDYCVLCGDKLPSLSMVTADDESDEEEEQQHHLQRAESNSSRGGAVNIVVNAAQSAHLMSPRPRKMSSLSRQQRRARNRREWSRKLDVEGNLFWYRSGGGNVPVSSELDTLMPGYTVSFTFLEEKKPEDEKETTNEDQEHDESEEEPSPENEPVLVVEQPQETKEDVLEKPELPTDLKVELVEASASDPAEFPTGKSTLVDAGPERRKETVSMAASDFPSKYAHFVLAFRCRVSVV